MIENYIGAENLLFIVHIGVSIAFFFYFIFSFVLIRQVHKMTDTLKVGFETPLKAFAWAHFMMAIGVFVASLVIL